jgi:hypothetical protein
MVIERLGKFNKVLYSGWHWVIPFIDSPRTITWRKTQIGVDGRLEDETVMAKRIDLRESTFNFMKQEVYTRDTVLLDVNSLMFYRCVACEHSAGTRARWAGGRKRTAREFAAHRCPSAALRRLARAHTHRPTASPRSIFDIKKATYEVEDLQSALSNTAQTQLKEVFGRMTFTEALASQREINEHLVQQFSKLFLGATARARYLGCAPELRRVGVLRRRACHARLRPRLSPACERECSRESSVPRGRGGGVAVPVEADAESAVTCLSSSAAVAACPSPTRAPLRTTHASASHHLQVTLTACPLPHPPSLPPPHPPLQAGASTWSAWSSSTSCPSRSARR